MSTENKDILNMTTSEIFLAMSIAGALDCDLKTVKFVKFFLKEFNLTITQLIKILEEEG